METDIKEYKILIIEDNLADFTLVEDFLFEKILVPKITEAKNFKTAGAILKAGNNQFDIVLLDLTLPDKTGQPLIHEIVELCPDTPIIVLTGYTDFAFGIRSLSLGISDYMLKDELTSTSLYKSIIYSIERKKYNDELKASEKRYSDVFDLSPLPMWVVNLDTLQFLDVNRATLSHYGYTREEFLSMTLKDIRPIEEIPKLEKGLAEGRDKPGLLSNNIMIHKKKNGELMSVEIQIAPFQYKSENVNIVIATDITERLNYIKAIENQNEQLKEISWMQSHIIRLPLSRIMGLIPLLKEKDEKDIETILDYIALSANELDEVIKNITDKTTTANYELQPKKN